MADSDAQRVRPVVLACADLGKRYRSRDAVVGVSSTFARGVSLVLGTNGAGKTTLLSMLATVIAPSSGRVTLDGEELRDRRAVDAARRRLGFLPQRFEVMTGARVEDNVAYAAWAHGSTAAAVPGQTERALAVVGLSERRRERARILSGGQRQRLAIACTIAHEPDVLVLDEPSVGLDPIQRASFRTLVRELAGHAAVIMSTHMVDEAAALGGSVLVLGAGRVRYQGTTGELAATAGHASDPARALEAALIGLLE